MIDYEKLTALFQDESFKKEAEPCDTMEAFQELFNSKGLEMTKDEVVEVISQIAEKKQQLDNGEITENDLENVAGGLVISTTVFCIGVGIACIGSGAAAAYAGYHALRWANKGK